MNQYQVVEDYSTDGAAEVYGGFTLPVPSLLQDSDGIRGLFLPAGTQTIPLRLWQKAYDGGAAWLLCVQGDKMLYVLADEFIETRTENQRAAEYGIKWKVWGESAESIAYRELVGEEEPAELIDSTDPKTWSPGSVYVNLHHHTEYSFDGLTLASESVEMAVADGQPALAMTDHGGVVGHPEHQRLCEAAGIKPIFGIEAYFQDDRFRRTRNWLEIDGKEVNPDHLTEDERKKAKPASDSEEARYGYHHLTLWAMTDDGLRNLWAMSTESYRDGLFDGRPRMDWDILERLNEGVLASTGCLRGPVAQALLKGDQTLARTRMARLLDIFGDRLYCEVHINHLAEQIRVNKVLIPMAKSMGIPLIAVSDSHYARPDQDVTHKVRVAMQIGKDVSAETGMFSGGQTYHMSTAAEVREALSIYADLADVDEMIDNTVVLAERCNARVFGETVTPTYSKPSKDHPDPVQRDVERVIEYALANWERKVVGKRESQEVYAARFEKEMALLISKQFCGYFLVVWDYVNWSKDHNILVGPGRGSGGGSLVAYLLGITELDPVEFDLIFERFLTEGRTSLPDFDIDFPASKRGLLKGYVEERWGHDHVATIGTVVRLQSKGAINDIVRTLRSILDYEIDDAEVKRLKDLIDEADAGLAGKHLPWDEFVAQFADEVDLLVRKYPEVFALVNEMVGRVKTYGKHPAGVVISTGEPLDNLPMRLVEDKQTGTTMMVTQWDMEDLEAMGYVKFDLLTLRTLDTVQVAMDLIAKRFDRPVRIYDWKEEYDDPQVWSEVAAGRTLGIFQIETKGMTRLTKRYQPHTMDELAAVITLVRPGPMRSGLTETYLRRRAGIEEVNVPEPRLEPVLGNTYGCMIYQEDIMQTVMTLAGYDSTEADTVRKILGKKQVEKVAAEGTKFLARAIENHTDSSVANLLWEQMAEFAKYSFGKAHAVGYAMLGYWTAWLKFHFPVQFITAALSTVDDERLPEFVNEARRMGYDVLGPDVNLSGVEFTPEQMTMRYGLRNVSGVGAPTAAEIVKHQPYTSYEDFIAKCIHKDSPVNMGHLKNLVAVGALDSLIDNRRAVEIQLERETSGAAKKCLFVDESVKNPRTGLPCSFDWDSEPNPPMITKGRGKNKQLIPKDPPKRCSVACRQYHKPSVVGADEVAPYSALDIRNRERELLGIWLSSSPFDQLPQSTLEQCAKIEDLEAAKVDQSLIGAVIVENIRERKDRNGDVYAFLTLNFQNGSIDVICFAKTWARFRRDVKKDLCMVVEVFRNNRGFTLTNVNLLHETDKEGVPA